MARQKLGQHFLKNSGVVGTILELLAPAHGEVIIEIGPGHGELTLPLARAAEKTSASVIAIEKDPELASSLELLASSEKRECKFEIIQGDVLKALPEVIKNYHLKAVTYKLVGNLPYYLTGYLLRTIGELDPKPEKAVFMVQKEVGERIVARPPHMNKLAATVQFWSDPHLVHTVPRADFAPPPKVDSALVVFEKKEMSPSVQPEHYYALVRALFQQPRKTILNNLRDAPHVFPRASHTPLSATPTDSAKKILAEAQIRASDRPGNLSVQDIERLASLLSHAE